jgi:oligoendopeptidase F
MSVVAPEQLTRAEVPIEETWDLSSYYVDDSAWERDLARIPELVATAASHRGALGESAARLRQALDDGFAARQLIGKVATFAHLRRDENVADQNRMAAFQRAVTAAISAGQELAFFQPELLQVEPERFESFLLSPELAPYRHFLEDLARHRPHTRSIEVEELLASSAEISRTAGETFSALNDADLNFGRIPNEIGEEVQLTKSRYQLFLESHNRELRQTAYHALNGEYKAHINTIASLLAGSIRNDNFYAQVRGYATAREAALHEDNIPEAVYDSLISAVAEAQPALNRYIALRSRITGVADIALYDMYVPLSPEPERKFTIPEGVMMVLDGVAPLGAEYVTDLRSLLNDRTVDWQETEGKHSGAYSSGSYGSTPVILMNWNGSTDHVFTLAHEAGHQMHTYYSHRNNPYHDAHYSIFLGEVASTVNEALLTWRFLEDLPVDEIRERFAILNRLADTIFATLVRQTMFADFEHRAHVAAAAAQPLTPETLSDQYGSTADIFRPGVLNDELARLEWTRIPHFYRAYYVFQYATGISSALAIARRIREDGEGARSRYLEMLRAGGSDYPINILQRAGVDLKTPEPVRQALAVFDETVAEMEKLADAAGFSAAA